jgi:hypothetical protein
VISANDFIAAVRSMGCVPRDLRDAAHEAHHAIVGKAKRWTRDGIHNALCKKLGPAERIADEIMARAVEQLVTEEITGEACGDIEHWAMWMCMEAIKDGIRGVEPDFAERAIRSAIDSEAGQAAAKRVIRRVKSITRAAEASRIST